MRYLFGFLCVCALGAMPLVGCSETTGDGGSGGTAGSGGSGGSAGAGGSGGIVSSACDRELCEGVDCDDADLCTRDVCSVADGTCSHVAVCDDFNDCTQEMCSAADGSCSTPNPVANGTPCEGGTCQDGTCELNGTVVPCTEQGIRNAIAAGDGTYTFACQDATQVVTQAEIKIANDVILDGDGKLTIDGNCDHRVLSVSFEATVELRRLALSGGFAADGGGVFNDGTLTMDGVTVARNATTNGPPPTKGAGLFNAGTLTVMNSTVARNTDAWLGGGMWNAGVLMMTNSVVSENECSGEGGGIINIDVATMTLTDTTVSGNHGNQGAGISNDGTLMLANSTVEGNTAKGGSGGGIVNAALGVLTLTNTTVRENRAEAVEGGEFGPIWGAGGGISNGGVLTLVKSTVSGNTAVEGGGILQGNDVESMTLINSTISGNTATGCEGISEEPGCGAVGVGGIWNRGLVTLTNCTVSGNTGDFTGGVWNEGELTLTSTLVHGECRGTDVVSNGYNIESPGDTCGFDQSTDQPGVSTDDLNLGALANNGGPTMTHKPGDGGLREGSVAIDQIPEADCEVGTDQRGQPRPAGPDPKRCDVGSVEVQGSIKSGLWLGGSPASNTDGTPFDTGWAICFFVNEDGSALTPSTDCDIDGDDDEAYMLEVSWKDDVGRDILGEVGVCNGNPERDSESIGIGASSGLEVPIEDNSFAIGLGLIGVPILAGEIFGTFKGDTASGTVNWDFSPGMGGAWCALDGGWTASPAP